MSKKVEQSLWVTSVSPREIYGQTYIPTAINYQKEGKPIVGRDAFDESTITNQNFKVDLGDVVPKGSTENRKKFKTNVGEKSAFDLTRDYFNCLLEQLEKEYPRSEETNFKHPAKIIVAEPLAFQIEGHSKQWLNNYRSNIRTVLDRYEQVEFLPEPFAVYQYYRYGLRLTTLQEKTKQIALILDFGGGTFDACIIESTQKGDISQSGRNSKPLSADSIPVGGFYINRRIAIYLIKRDLDNKQKSTADNYINKYERMLKGELELSDLRKECQVFINNLSRLESLCEDYKLSMVSQLSNSDWGVNNDAYQKTIVSIPIDPFKQGDWFETEFYAHNLRDVFIKDIWDKHLKGIIASVIKRAEESLAEKNITTTLMSGGSSNFRWMLDLLERDFSEELYGAEPVPIEHSFQEIVANGLV